MVQSVQSWAARIRGLYEDIDEIVEEEAVERELKLAEMLLKKSDNLRKHRNAIQSRPAKEWFKTNNEKKRFSARLKSTKW